MASFTLAIKATLSHPTIGAVAINPPQQSGTPDYASLAYELASGDNSIPVPSAANYAIILFDPNSVTNKTLKGAAPDTGLLLSPNGIMLLSLRSTLSAIIINSSANDTGMITNVIFF